MNKNKIEMDGIAVLYSSQEQYDSEKQGSAQLESRNTNAEQVSPGERITRQQDDFKMNGCMDTSFEQRNDEIMRAQQVFGLLNPNSITNYN